MNDPEVRSTIVLNSAQIAVLEWIKAGCPDGVYPEGDFGHRISARALQSRGLVQVSGHGARWRAQLTERGKAWPAAVPADTEARKLQAQAMSSVAFGRGFFYRVFRRTGCGFAAQYAASCSAGGTWPSSPWRRRSLYQSTHSAVANSTSLMPTHGPRLRMSSAL